MATFMTHKRMVGAGAVVIVAMLLIAAFSMGVYVGENGWTWQGVSLTGPAGRPGGVQPPVQGVPGAPQAGAPMQPVPGAGSDLSLPARPPDLRGRVRALENGILELASPDGPRAAQLTDQTQVQTPEGGVAGTDVLQTGMMVAVFGRRGDGGQMLIADIVVIIRE